MLRLFEDGEKVVDTLKGKTGKIVGFVGGDETRYYVNHSGYTWSVPQKYLKSAPKKIK